MHDIVFCRYKNLQIEQCNILLLLFRYSNKMGPLTDETEYYLLDFEKYGTIGPINLQIHLLPSYGI